MTLQQKLLWERLTKEVREAGMDNLRARELYDELSKLIDMSKETTVLSITETEQGLEVRISEKAYGNLAIIGLVEQIKFNLLNTEDSPQIAQTNQINKDHKYDA